MMNNVPLDLNLLQTFDAVHATRSVSRAAERLGVSQPTVSHALAKMRVAWRDPLFVRSAGGMAPTAKADRMAEAVRQALAILDVALVKGERFDPARTRRTFRLHMSDIGETVFLPKLMHALAAAAPHARLETFQLDDREQLAAIENGRIDLALGYLPALASVEKKVLVHERYVVLARAGHPLARRPATAATLGALDYALVRSHSATARALTELGLIDRVRLTLPHFLVLPRILAETDLAVLVPSNLAQVFLQQAQFVVWRPRALPPFDVSIHWYWRYEGDPGNRWLRELIASLFAQR